MVFDVRPDRARCEIFVDPTYPDAWREPLRYADIKRWSIDAIEGQAQFKSISVRGW